MKTNVLTLLFTALLIFTGCSSDDNSDTNKGPKEVTGQVEISKVSQLKLTDANGYPLKGATISVASSVAKSVSKSSALAPSLAPTIFTVGTDGLVSIDDLGDGLYTITITIGTLTFTTTIEIGSENYQAAASVTTPVSLQEDGNATLIENAIIASISGTIIDSQNVAIANAQVSISGGVATNGAFATAITDENGAYTLLINVNDTLSDALSTSTLTASSQGYSSQSKTDFSVVNNSNKSGVNFTLISTDKQTTIYAEDFEADNSSWVINKLDGINANNSWHTHTSAVTGVNKAYSDGLVQLAPNDISAGTVASPKGTQCFWYGNNVQEDSTFGSFIGVLGDSSELNGGTGTSSNSAELISPSIDLTNVTGDLRLSFDTYWEIESVNPNLSGFDVMTISISIDDGQTWRDLAKLNPLSDPQTDIDRSAIPFSNTGYNSAPMWLTQEAIPLVDIEKESLSGQTIKLKFTFQTNDELFNGFRGWMIDNIVISQGTGTFPLVEDLDAYYTNNEDNVYNAPSLSSQTRRSR